MTEASFYQALRKENDTLWQRIFSHPFVEGLGKGSLSRDRYEFFLKQDYVYLIDFSRVFALASAKADTLADMGYLSTLLQATLNAEMDLHRKTCTSYGISTTELENTEPAMITTAYTNLLIRTCYEGDFLDILSVLLPCAVGYAEIGQRLESRGLPEDPFYRDWIHTYSSEEYLGFVKWLKAKTDEQARGMPEDVRKKCHRLYRSSARYEYLFFEMSWNLETWPGRIDT
jgi:thiaminase (transcriptional activator TenA)